MIFDRHANLKYKYGNRHFWRRGYYVDTVGRNKEAIAKYIRNQLQEDAAQDQRKAGDAAGGEVVGKLKKIDANRRNEDTDRQKEVPLYARKLPCLCGFHGK